MKLFVYPYEQLPENQEAGIIYANRVFKIFVDQINSCSPKEADFFIVPIKVKAKTALAIRTILLPNLSYYKLHPDKHIFFLTLDHPSPQVVQVLSKSILFKTSLSKQDQNSYCLHYNPIVFPDLLTPISSCQYEVGFMGAFMGELRQDLAKVCSKFKLNSFIQEHQFWNSTKELNENAKIEYNSMMKNCKFILCPKGNALNSTRFFESLCYGRIPVLISDDTRLPLETKIDYDRFILRIPESKIEKVEQHVIRYMQNHDLEKISKMCRNVWEKYFSEQSIEFFIVQSLLEKMQVHIPLL
jgi:hypothetical protein